MILLSSVSASFYHSKVLESSPFAPLVKENFSGQNQLPSVLAFMAETEKSSQET